ncbi:MAG: MlaD family protein [Phycisphaerales bacterium]
MTPPEAPVALVRRSRGLNPVWVVPLVALAVAAALVLRDLLSQGPRVQVAVTSADGLEPGRSPVKCRGVVVGRVAAVTLSPEGLTPTVTVELEPWARGLLHADAAFWVERPEISLQGIRGLGTLASGPFLAVEPGTTGTAPRQFTALPRPPVVDAPGLLVTLRSPRLYSLRRGSPVLYRDVAVGQVIDLRLAPDARNAEIVLRVDPAHSALVRQGSRFWNASGFSLDVGITGLTAQAESLESVLVGGVAFASPDPPGEPATQGAVFDLAEKADAAWLRWAPSIQPATGREPPR